MEGGKGKMKESAEKPAFPECRANAAALVISSISLWTALLKIEIQVHQIKFEAYEPVIFPQTDKKIRQSKLTSKDGFVTQN